MDRGGQHHPSAPQRGRPLRWPRVSPHGRATSKPTKTALSASSASSCCRSPRGQPLRSSRQSDIGTKAGLDRARAEGKTLGRPWAGPDALRQLAAQQRLGGASYGEIAKNLNVGRSTVRSWLRRAGVP